MTEVFAHAESGPGGLAALAFFGVIAVGAAIWLVRLNRRLDAKEVAVPVPPTPVESRAHIPGTTEADAPRRSRKGGLGWILAGVVVLGAIAVVGIMLSSRSHDGPGDPQQVVSDLCVAAEQAPSDPSAALATFNSGPHNALHSLGAELRTQDPIAAASLAEAKDAAESAMLSDDPDAGELTAVLATETAGAYLLLEPDSQINGCR